MKLTFGFYQRLILYYKIRVLADFATQFGVGQDKHIILTLDQAGWHSGNHLIVPKGLHLEYMPSHSPELQPAELKGPLVNEPIANRSFDTLEQLEEILFQRCRFLLQHPALIKGIACYHWWPGTAT